MICKRNNRSSLLRYRLTLQQEQKTPDDMGGYSKTWKDVADLWAEIQPINGMEKMFGEQLQASVTHRIVIRYRSGVDAGQRLLFEKRIFNIRYIKNTMDNKQTLELFAEEGVAT